MNRTNLPWPWCILIINDATCGAAAETTSLIQYSRADPAGEAEALRCLRLSSGGGCSFFELCVFGFSGRSTKVICGREL